MPRNAMNPYDDPLGIALQSRAMNGLMDFHNQEMDNGNINQRPIQNILPDVRWHGLLQGLQELAGDKFLRVGQDSFTPRTGPTYNPSFQSAASEGMSPSNNMATPWRGFSLDQQASGQFAQPLMAHAGPGPMQGLERAGQFQATKQPIRGRLRIKGQRGTSGTNQSERA